jgi:hypothetical protein
MDLEGVALAALHEAVDRLCEAPGRDRKTVLRELLGGDPDEVSLDIIDSSMFLAHAEREQIRLEANKAEACRMIEEREAAERAAENASATLMEQPIPTIVIPDYDKIVARMKAEGEECFPYIKVSVKWPTGGGESPWALDLGDGLALMSNSTLYPKYRFHDIFRFSGSYAGEVVHRSYPINMLYAYEPLEDEKADEDRRQLLIASLKNLRVYPGFFSSGHGYVLLREGVTPSEVKAALRASGVPVSDEQIQDFDVAKGSYTYQAVE